MMMMMMVMALVAVAVVLSLVIFLGEQVVARVNIRSGLYLVHHHLGVAMMVAVEFDRVVVIIGVGIIAIVAAAVVILVAGYCCCCCGGGGAALGCFRMRRTNLLPSNGVVIVFIWLLSAEFLGAVAVLVIMISLETSFGFCGGGRCRARSSCGTRAVIPVIIFRRGLLLLLLVVVHGRSKLLPASFFLWNLLQRSTRN